MIAEQIRARGVADPRVLDAMSRVARHLFIPAKDRGEAYEDRPVAIGFGQTISQPYIVGFMTESLKIEPSHRVLEIGTGCGYQTAVLAELARAIYSIERIDALATVARRTLEELGYTNVHLRTGDGHAGWPEHAPYDRILGAAAAASVPPALVEQLVDGGILVIPVGTSDQQLQVLRKRGDTTQLLSSLPVRFVPMIREQ
jgi:protein-L-isoaspartate(D-aspartate) O-methyltransferase